MSDLSHPDDDEASAIDAVVDADHERFMAEIRAMSSASHKPSRHSGVFDNGQDVSAHHALPPKGAGIAAVRCGYLDRQGR